jgi:hypothetical protein
MFSLRITSGGLPPFLPLSAELAAFFSDVTDPSRAAGFISLPQCGHNIFFLFYTPY